MIDRTFGGNQSRRLILILLALIPIGVMAVFYWYWKNFLSDVADAPSSYLASPPEALSDTPQKPLIDVIDEITPADFEDNATQIQQVENETDNAIFNEEILADEQDSKSQKTSQTRLEKVQPQRKTESKRVVKTSPIRVFKPDSQKMVVKKTYRQKDAFMALNKGRLSEAEESFRYLLLNNPKNIKAMHGLAIVFQRTGRITEALEIYLSILDINPQDSTAIANLSTLLSKRDNPISAERRLLELIEGQPNQPALYFALGNLYASRGQWDLAQQSFFDAYTRDVSNPDYIFNLGVSLDQLGKSKLAARYYQDALLASRVRSAGFSIKGVHARLKDLIE